MKLKKRRTETIKKARKAIGLPPIKKIKKYKDYILAEKRKKKLTNKSLDKPLDN